jgi:hypothetical protein
MCGKSMVLIKSQTPKRSLATTNKDYKIKSMYVAL